MEVTLAALADSANISQEGKLNILGEFNAIHVLKLPARHPSMSLVLRFEAGPAEYGQEKQISIRFMGADGNVVKDLATFPMTVPDAGPGKRARILTVQGIQDTELLRHGDYAFVVLINGDQKASVPLEVVPIEAAVTEEDFDGTGS